MVPAKLERILQVAGGCVAESYRPPNAPRWASLNIPLHKSLDGRNFDAARLLLKHGEDEDQYNALERAPLRQALHSDQWTGVGLQRVNFLLDHRVNINLRTEAHTVDFEDKYILGEWRFPRR
ncbi:hypothetical protein DPSP01_013751 [Paraphaeosphaeria sporulosa]